MDTKRHSRGASLHRWRLRNGINRLDLGTSLGDRNGHQIAKFESGERNLPIWLAVALSVRSKVPLRRLLTPGEYRMAKKLSALLARDRAT